MGLSPISSVTAKAASIHSIAGRSVRRRGRDLLDGDALAQDAEFFDIGETVHSRDHAQLGWSVDDKGSDSIPFARVRSATASTVRTSFMN